MKTTKITSLLMAGLTISQSYMATTPESSNKLKNILLGTSTTLLLSIVTGGSIYYLCKHHKSNQKGNDIIPSDSKTPKIDIISGTSDPTLPGNKTPKVDTIPGTSDPTLPDNKIFKIDTTLQMIDNAINTVNDFIPNYDYEKIKQTFGNPDMRQNFPLVTPMVYKVEDGPYLAENSVIEKANEVTNIFRNEPSLLRINSDKGIIVVGDLHANLDSAKGIILNFLNRYRSGEVEHIVFLGNYTGDGFLGIETLTFIYTMKSIMPNNIHLIRGNLDDIDAQDNIRCNSINLETYVKYDRFEENGDSVLLRAFRDSYEMLPLATVINDNCFCVHSGLSKSIIEQGGIDKIDQIQRPCGTPWYETKTTNQDSSIVRDLCWNSFSQKRYLYDHFYVNDQTCRRVRRRDGWAKIDGSDGDYAYNKYIYWQPKSSKFPYKCDWNILKRFLRNNNLKTLVSGHVYKNKDDDLGGGFRHITLLSSEKLHNDESNKCCVAVIREGQEPVMEEVDTSGGSKEYTPDHS